MLGRCTTRRWRKNQLIRHASNRAISLCSLRRCRNKCLCPGRRCSNGSLCFFGDFRWNITDIFICWNVHGTVEYWRRSGMLFIFVYYGTQIQRRNPIWIVDIRITSWLPCEVSVVSINCLIATKPRKKLPEIKCKSQTLAFLYWLGKKFDRFNALSHAFWRVCVIAICCALCFLKSGKE